MKKTVWIAGTLLSTLLLGSIPAFADEPQPASSKGKIEFTENTDETGPKDPTDPTKPGDPETTPTGNKGPLSIDVVPSFDFGTHKLTQAENTYYDVSADDVLHYIQVTDERDDANGWIVKATRTEFTETSAATDTTGSATTTPAGAATLTGSTIIIPAGEARNALNAEPTAAITDGSLAAQEELGFQANAETTFFTAKNQEGVGKTQSTDSWTANQTGLHIPKLTAKKGSFESTINWTIVTDVAS